MVDACGHAKPVQFYFVQPLRPSRRLLDRLGKLGRNEARRGEAPARRTGLDGLRAERLTTRDMLQTQPRMGIASVLDRCTLAEMRARSSADDRMLMYHI